MKTISINMNKFRNFIGAGLLFVFAFVSCTKDDADIPPIESINPDDIINLGDIREMIVPGETYTFHNSGKQLFATVTMDERNGNIYRQAYIQDPGGAINLRMAVSADLMVGDSIRLALDGASVSYFNNMLQLDSVDGTKQIVKQAEEKFIEPEVLTINEIKAGGYQAQLVQINNVQFLENELGETWADGINLMSVNRTLQDCDNNTIIVRTSGYADFANEILPEGNGSFIGIVGQFGDVWQLYVRDPNELTMTNERCEIDTGESGSGTFEDPYNVAYAYNNNSGDNVWIQGYIIGVMETNVDPFEPSFTAPFNTNSNIIIADSPDETNLNNALIVQLPFGDIRNVLNLVDNPQMQGELVKLKGNLELYFGVPGLKETSDYWYDGDIPPPPEAIFEENFDSDLGDFTDYNIAGEQIWTHATFDGGTAYVNGFSGGSARENENWLISPMISLENHTGVFLKIREAINYITNYNDVKVLIANDFDGENPAESGTWVEFSGFNRPPGDSWTYIDSGEIDISQFDGDSIHIAFKYTSTTSGASAWQISKVALEAEE